MRSSTCEKIKAFGSIFVFVFLFFKLFGYIGTTIYVRAIAYALRKSSKTVYLCMYLLSIDSIHSFEKQNVFDANMCVSDREKRYKARNKNEYLRFVFVNSNNTSLVICQFSVCFIYI